MFGSCTCVYWKVSGKSSNFKVYFCVALQLFHDDQDVSAPIILDVMLLEQKKKIKFCFFSRGIHKYPNLAKYYHPIRDLKGYIYIFTSIYYDCISNPTHMTRLKYQNSQNAIFNAFIFEKTAQFDTSCRMTKKY